MGKNGYELLFTLILESPWEMKVYPTDDIIDLFAVPYYNRNNSDENTVFTFLKGEERKRFLELE